MTLKHEELTVEGIKQVFLDCNGEDDKYRVLVQLYGLMTIASSIIFVKVRYPAPSFSRATKRLTFLQRRDTAAEIERRLTQDGHKVAQLSGALEGPQRDEIIDRFRDGRAKVLITTNVLARGIDVQSVSIVVNYVSPPTFPIPRSHSILQSFITNTSANRSQGHPRNPPRRARLRDLPAPHRAHRPFRPCRRRRQLRPRPGQLAEAGEDRGLLWRRV